MRWRRLVALGLLAVLIAPGTWLRSAPVTDPGSTLRFAPLAAETPDGWPQGLTLRAAWHLDSTSPNFGGFSALLHEPDGSFRGFTDFGMTSDIPRPTDGPVEVAVEFLPPDPRITAIPDVESAVYHRASDTLWLGYENHNAIRRIDADGTSSVTKPAQMRHWGKNSGAEAMARLADGRFLLLGERNHEGLLFAADPLREEPALAFRVSAPEDYSPTDMALLPDGRVLVLLRALRWRLPPFASMLALGDPATIRAGETWVLEPFAALDTPGLHENYEGLAVAPEPDGSLAIWLISDDNRSALQRTLLLELHWQGADMETARQGNPRAP